MENLEKLQSIIETSKLFQLMSRVDTQIKKNFKFEGIATRPVNSNGLWCFTLIPAILLSYTFCYEVTPVYRLLAFISIGHLVYSILFILFLYMSCLVLRGSYTSGCTAAVFCAAIPIYYILQYDLATSLIYPLIAVGSYSAILKKFLLNCPCTFTVGEAMVVAQGFSLTLTTCILTVFPEKVFPDMKDDDEIKLIKTVVITVLSTVGLLVTALWNLKKQHRTLLVLSGLLVLAAIVAGAALYKSLGRHFLFDFINYIFRDKLRSHLLLFWFLLVVVAATVVKYRAQIGVKVTSSTRKTLHLLASLVFLSGVLLDKHLIMLAAGSLLGVIVLMEALRVSGIEPISSCLQTAFNVYADEKDVGVFAMTPLYLYVGLACPLALVPWTAGRGAELELLGGVLSVGVGDSAASWVGERYGRNKWRGSNRTLEGTIANVGSQIFTVYAINLFGLFPWRGWVWVARAGAAGSLAALAEARLQQVDNLVLPLLTLLALQLTAFLR